VTLIFDHALNRSTIAVFIDKVIVVDSLQDLDELNYVVIVLDLGQCLDFVDGALLQLGTHLELLDFDDFNGDQLIVAFVSGLVHFSVLAFPYNLLQVVVLDLLYHKFSVNNYYLLLTCPILEVALD
jgi:hypothetical protein